MVKKPSTAAIPWDKCTVKDVRLVVGLNPLNKFLMDPPGKITKTESIYTTMANWEYMGELDFSDFYFEIKFRTDCDKQKLGYLCIRSAIGTLCFSSATMALLGMDVFQDELTDKLLGDLVLSGNLIKLADNVYFGANSIQDFQQLFETILHRCEAADLRLKPSKLKLIVQSADILGLHWHRGALSPSHHKLDPSPTPTYTRYDQDSDSDNEDHILPFPMPIFPRLHLTNLMRPLLQILSSFPLVVMLFMTNLLFPLTWMMLMPSSYLPWTWFLLWKRSRTKLNILLYTLSNHSMARNHT